MKRTKIEIEKDVKETEEKLEDAVKRMPKHTVRPHQLMALEELEDRLEELKVELAEIS